MEVEEAAAASSSWPVVYLGGWKIDPDEDVWYRVDVESLKTTEVEGEAPGGDGDGDGDVDVVKCKSKKRKVLCQSSMGDRPMYRWVSVKKPDRPMYRWVSVKKPNTKKKIHRVTLYPAAQTKQWQQKGCAIVGEDLYCFGRASRSIYMDLIKHDTNDAKPLSWEPLCSFRGQCWSNVALLPVGRKLYVLSGIDPKFNLCGQLYDLDCNKCVNLKCNFTTSDQDRYHFIPYVALAENKQEILFYFLKKGSILFFDSTGGEFLRKEDTHAPLALWSHSLFSTPPSGLEACGNIQNLIAVTRKRRGSLINNTLYWFTGDMYLYGYDINLKKWIHSPFLGEQFPTLTPGGSFIPFLVDLHYGRFLVIIPEGPGEITVSPITVVRDEHSLTVTVDSFHHLSVDDTSFMTIAEMSMMLENTWSDTMRQPKWSIRRCHPGPVKSARET